MFPHPGSLEAQALLRSPTLPALRGGGIGETACAASSLPLAGRVAHREHSERWAGWGSTHDFALPRRDRRPSLASMSSLKQKRAQGKPDARCTRSLACKWKKHTSKSTTGTPVHAGLPCANGFTASFALSPETWLCCLRHWHDTKHRRQLDTCLGVSGPHDFAVRSQRHSSNDVKRPSHPALNVRDDAQRPSDRGGTGGNSHGIDMKGKRNIFR
jgi:hypothetical protein